MEDHVANLANFGIKGIRLTNQLNTDVIKGTVTYFDNNVLI